MAIKSKIDGNSRISLSDDQLFDQSTGNATGLDSTSGNTFIGYLAGQSVDAGSINNTFIGHGVGDATLSNATGNVGLGAGALSALTQGDKNVAIGLSAAAALEDASSNVIIGAEAGDALTSGASNVIIGQAALGAADGAEHNNVVIGKSAGESINHDNADNNVFIGKDVGAGGAAAITQNIGIGVQCMDSFGAEAMEACVAVGYQALRDPETEANGTVALGHQALSACTTGDKNIAIGYQAAYQITTGYHNVIIGHGALDAADGGENHNIAIGVDTLGSANENGVSANIAIGTRAMDSTGAQAIANCVAIGYQALQNAENDADATIAIGKSAGNKITTGVKNVLIGRQSGDQGSYGLTTGSYNTAVGSDTLGASAAANITGSNNTAIGYSAMLEAQGNVYQNTAVGSESMTDIQTGVDNVSIGYYSMRVHTTGSRNTVAGSNAMKDTNVHSNTKDSSDNTFLGYLSGGGTWTGSTACSYNTAVGSEAMDGALDGAGYNVAVGWRAGDALTGGDKCTVIGAEADAGSAGAINQTAIGYGTQAVDSNNSITLGNADVDTVCMSQDQDATVHCGGIRFPSTFSNEANANTLDDYEQGEYDVTVTGGTSGGFNMQSNEEAASYTRIGDLVHVQGGVQIASEDSCSGNIRFSLPFASGNNTDFGERSYGTVWLVNTSETNAGHMVAVNNGSAAYFEIGQVSDGGSNTYLTNAHVDGSWFLGFQITYKV